MEKVISYNEFMKRISYSEKLKSNGVKFVYRNYKLLGWVCVSVGLITFFIPLTTIPLLVLGCGLIGINVKELKSLYSYYKKRLLK